MNRENVLNAMEDLLAHSSVLKMPEAGPVSYTHIRGMVAKAQRDTDITIPQLCFLLGYIKAAVLASHSIRLAAAKRIIANHLS